MKLNKLIEILSEAKERYGEETNVNINDDGNWRTDIDEIFYDNETIVLGAFNGCNWSSYDFYHRVLKYNQ